MTNNQISTISEFLLHAGTNYRVFDMGRGIKAIDSQIFLNWENGSETPGAPRAGHAWIGLIFWDKSRSEQQYIWFIKLPLDEQGKIIVAARDQFLQIIVEALGVELENAEQKNGQLPENPYTFIPNQNQLADFNSISRKAVDLGTSQFFLAAKRYVQSPTVVDWQTLSVQGLADVVANMENEQLADVLVRNFDIYPLAVQNALLTSMENTSIPDALAQKIEQWLMAQPDNPVQWQFGLRALCQSQSALLCKNLVTQVLSSQLSSDQDTLAVISGRLWQVLLLDNLLMDFLECCANQDNDFRFFQAVFSDLVRIPSMRDGVLSILRDTNKSSKLTNAVGTLFTQPAEK